MKDRAQLKSDLDQRINRARLAGACKGYTMTEFKNYLLEVGLAKYVKSILPAEQGNYSGAITEYQQTEGKIIPFPGVTLDPTDTFQDRLNDFLIEMGYID